MKHCLILLPIIIWQVLQCADSDGKDDQPLVQTTMQLSTRKRSTRISRSEPQSKAIRKDTNQIPKLPDQTQSSNLQHLYVSKVPVISRREKFKVEKHLKEAVKVDLEGLFNSKAFKPNALTDYERDIYNSFLETSPNWKRWSIIFEKVMNSWCLFGDSNNKVMPLAFTGLVRICEASDFKLDSNSMRDIPTSLSAMYSRLNSIFKDFSTESCSFKGHEIYSKILWFFGKFRSTCSPEELEAVKGESSLEKRYRNRTPNSNPSLQGTTLEKPESPYQNRRISPTSFQDALYDENSVAVLNKSAAVQIPYILNYSTYSGHINDEDFNESFRQRSIIIQQMYHVNPVLANAISATAEDSTNSSVFPDGYLEFPFEPIQLSDHPNTRFQPDSFWVTDSVVPYPLPGHTFQYSIPHLQSRSFKDSLTHTQSYSNNNVLVDSLTSVADHSLISADGVNHSLTNQSCPGVETEEYCREESLDKNE